VSAENLASRPSRYFFAARRLLPVPNTRVGEVPDVDCPGAGWERAAWVRERRGPPRDSVHRATGACRGDVLGFRPCAAGAPGSCAVCRRHYDVRQPSSANRALEESPAARPRHGDRSGDVTHRSDAPTASSAAARRESAPPAFPCRERDSHAPSRSVRHRRGRSRANGPRSPLRMAEPVPIAGREHRVRGPHGGEERRRGRGAAAVVRH